MGAQDSFELAGDFRTQTGAVTPLMIWDAGFDTWSYYGVRGQPTAILVDKTGQPIKGWQGAFDEAEVLELAASA